MPTRRMKARKKTKGGMSMAGEVMLNEEGIADVMRNVIDHLSQHNFDQAELALVLLDFERLLQPIPDLLEQGRRHFVDPAISFEVERVHETGDHIRICRDAIARSDRVTALDEVEKGLARWTQK
jgi:hypothetical protein